MNLVWSLESFALSPSQTIIQLFENPRFRNFIMCMVKLRWVLIL